jgi:hypothetical protein
MAGLLLSIFAWLLLLIGGSAPAEQKPAPPPAAQTARAPAAPGLIRVAGVPRLEDLPDLDLLHQRCHDQAAAIKLCARTDRCIVIRRGPRPAQPPAPRT